MTTQADTKAPNEMTYPEKANHYVNLCRSQQVEISMLESREESYKRALEQDEEIFRRIRAEVGALGSQIPVVSGSAILFHIRGRGDDPDTYEDDDEA